MVGNETTESCLTFGSFVFEWSPWFSTHQMFTCLVSIGDLVKMWAPIGLLSG